MKCNIITHIHDVGIIVGGFRVFGIVYREATPMALDHAYHICLLPMTMPLSNKFMITDIFIEHLRQWSFTLTDITIQ